jgi:isoleucyl-tRNA synthetase
MQKVRDIVTQALEARSKANIKVRQPLSSLIIKENISSELCAIIADEVNVKEVSINTEQTEDVVLDTHITQELKEEGIARDIIRAIQDARKKENLIPSQTITLSISGIKTEFLNQWGEMIQKPTGITEITYADIPGAYKCNVEDFNITFSLVY